MNKINVLVTGAGSLVGQGILRLLRLSNLQLKVITADPDSKAPGHLLGDKSYIVPLAKDPSFNDTIVEIIKQENINIIFIGTDVELTYFAQNKQMLENLGPKVIVCSEDTVKIADNKFLTMQFLKDNGFEYPESALSSNEEECDKLLQKVGFPLFCKPVQGARSVGAKIINNHDDYNQAKKDKSLIFQELLTGDEYTAGCVGMNGNIGGVVVLKRDLKDGNTVKAYHDGTDKFQQEIKEIAEKLDICGSCNFQFKIKNGKPAIFEINARCSGTTPIRHLFGFNEIEAIINNIFTNKPLSQPKLKSGMVLRTFSDVFVNDDLVFEMPFLL